MGLNFGTFWSVAPGYLVIYLLPVMSRITLTHYVSFVVIFFCSNTESKERSAFICSGSWNITRENSNNTFFQLQRWIHASQNLCGKVLSPGLHVGNGIGSGIESAARWLMWAIEANQIYRPTESWAWADKDKSGCTVGQTVDCYFYPISSCANSDHLLAKKDLHLQSHDEQQYNESTAVFGVGSMDACAIARAAKKPLQWVHGSVLHYIMRLNDSIKVEVDAKIAEIRRQALNGSVVGVHIRRGSPDHGRHPANTSYYISAVDTLAAQLETLGRPISVVFICSDLQQELESNISVLFPRPWKYVLLPHFIYPPQLLGKHEIQHIVESGRLERNGFSRRTMAMEYFTDVEILAQADAFIGSSSNVYTLVTALRVARGFDSFANHSCFMKLTTSPPTLHCEGTQDALEEWRHHSFGGYTGGALFWNYTK